MTIKEKSLWLISGEVRGIKKLVKEYAYAYSRAQAMKLVAVRLEKENPRTRIYLGDCAVEKIEKPST